MLNTMADRTNALGGRRRMSRSILIRELLWVLGLAVLALALTWGHFDFDWPTAPDYVFYAPYSVVTVAPWPLAGIVFLTLVGVRLLVVIWQRCGRQSVGKR